MLTGMSLLRERNFLLLFLATLITTFGSAMAPIALAFGVLELTGSTSASAIVIAAPVVAQLLILMVSGTLADRTSRRQLIIYACAWAALFQALIAVAFIAEFATVPLLTGLTLMGGVVIAITFPATTGLIPLIVSHDQLQDANSLLGIARNTSLVLGTALAGALVAALGPGVALALDSATFAIASILYISLKPAEQKRLPPASFFEDIRKGWQAFISHRWLWIMVVQFSFVAASIQSVNGLLGPAVTRSHMNGAVDWGLISAGLGAGTLLGGIVAMRIRVERTMLVSAFLILFFAIPPLMLAGPVGLWWLVAGALVSGVARQVFIVLWQTTVQTRVAPEMLSRVSAYDFLGSFALAPLGILFFGYLYEMVGYRVTLLSCAAMIVVTTTALFFVRDVRELRLNDTSPESDKDI